MWRNLRSKHRGTFLTPGKAWSQIRTRLIWCEWSNCPTYIAHSGFSINIDWIKDKINDWVNDCRRVFLIQTWCEEGSIKEGWWHTSTWNLSISLHALTLTPLHTSVSACVELTLQWELAFVYFYPLHRTLKPTFPLGLNKVLVLHHSEKAAYCCHPLNWNKDLIIIFFEKVLLSVWTSSSSHPCYWSVRNAMCLTHFLLGCVFFGFILK